MHRFATVFSILLFLINPCPIKAQAKKPGNRLSQSASPYLLQHAHNPVDWYPWGKEAFEKARKEQKPIFLSVGYAACHWCHVMERESFTDEAIARILNESFVCIKVDREERPDVDAVYMAALQAFLGGGGWPMNMMLTPDGKPFFGLTYMPPRDKDGDEGFESLLKRVRDAWRDHRAELEKDSKNLSDAARRLAAAESALIRRSPIAPDLTEKALSELADQFDPNYGGFGSSSRQPKAPKFPEPANLLFLLELAKDKTILKDQKLADKAREMALTTIDAIARGGVRDHLGGGIHRYSTDRYWLVPHFEKMLYDNALWMSVCARAFELTGENRWKKEVDDTVKFLKSSLLLPSGGFASSLDADTNGQEGLTYVWSREELEKLITNQPEASLFRDIYGLKLAPNFENRDFILAINERWNTITDDTKLSQESINAKLDPIRASLLAARAKRPQPGLDDKCLTSWTGLAIGGLADAGHLTGNKEALAMASTAAGFILDKHLKENVLTHVSRGDVVSPDGPFLEDYAYLVDGLLKLHKATGEQKWLNACKSLSEKMIELFGDSANGGFFETTQNATDLFVRPRNLFDNAMPSPAGVATLNLVELAEVTGNKAWAETARKSVEAASGFFTTSPDSVLSLVRAAVKSGQTNTAKALAAADKPQTAKPAKPMPVKATRVGPETIKVTAGKEVKVEFDLLIEPKYHTYGNPSGVDSAKPTEVDLEGTSAGPVRLKRVDYPAGEAKQVSSAGLEPVVIYEGRQRFAVLLEVPAAAAPGKVKTNLVVTYQVCTDQFCLPPTKLRLPVTLDIVKP
ncbi:MAG: DUF255 domain-containing protein [bacterium]